MRSPSILLYLLLLTAYASGQSAPQATPLPPLPKEPQEIFAAAAPLYDFSAPTVKPWHIKVSYQLYDETGKPSDRGTYDYWWAAPETYRSSWTRPGLSQTDWHVHGQHYHAGEGRPLSFFERKLQSDILTPLPKPEDLAPEKVRFDKEQQKFGSVKLPCVMVVPEMHLHAHAEQIPLGEFPTYCFAPDHPVLRAYYAFGATSVIYNRVVQVQGVYLPKEIRIQDGDRLVLSAAVDTIERLSPSAPELLPAKEAQSVPSTPRVEIDSAVAQGQLLKKVAPHYPEQAKIDHDQGTVVLHALIGTDGRIHDLSVVQSPSASLVGAAMWAVSQWEYKPYLLNGNPVEVNTTIKLIFKLGG